MKNTHWIIKLLAVSSSLIFSEAASAYGGGGSGASACKPPDFKKFKPPASSVVAPKSEFSFVASPDTRAATIKVAVKKIDVDVNIEKQLDGKYLVSGKIPDSLVGTWAKIKIIGKAGNCSGTDAWLLRIAEGQPAPAKPQEAESE